MVEKLQARKRDDGFLEPATPSDIHWKINELVDAVNYLQNHIADTSKKVDDRMIGCTTLDIPESYKTKGGDND